MIAVFTVKSVFTAKGLVSQDLTGSVLMLAENITRFDSYASGADSKVWYKFDNDNHRETPAVFVIDQTPAQVTTEIETAPDSEAISINVFPDNDSSASTAARNIKQSDIKWGITADSTAGTSWLYLKAERTKILVDHTLAEIVALVDPAVTTTAAPTTTA